MDTRRIDLHVHSTASDGTFSPSELVVESKRIGLSAFALTDHDTTDGCAEASIAATDTDIEVIPGVELSCEYSTNDFSKEVHIVGLYIDPNNDLLKDCLHTFRNSRNNRNLLIIENLQKEGFDITYTSLLAHFPDGVITRAHIARYLLDMGYIKDMNVAFTKYIGDGCRCYVPRAKISPIEGISLIKQAGGLAFLAHPLLYHMSTVTLDQLVSKLKKAGLTGIESIYSTYQPDDERSMKKLAKKYELLISGGSDFHGTNKPRIHLGTGMGHLYIPYSVLDDIKNRVER